MTGRSVSKIGLLYLLGVAAMASTRDLQQDQVLHGTVNVALGNQNGMVIAADRLLSGGHHPVFAQKLFQLDKRSVCTIAGFYSTDDPTGLQFYQEPESALHLEIRGVIAFLREEFEKHQDLTIAEKARVLAFQISLAIQRRNTVHDAQTAARAARSRLTRESDSSQFLIAGYDPDGSPELAKVVMKVDPTGESVTVDEASQAAVRKDLVWKTAGIEDEAIGILSGTTAKSSERSDPRLTALYSAQKPRSGSSLSVAQMTDIARAVVQHSASANPTKIGFDADLAVLQNGEVSLVDQNEPAPLPLLKSHQPLFVDAAFKTTPGGLANYRPFAYYGSGLYVRSTFEHVSVTLDSSFFAGNILRDCEVFYDGEPFNFEPDNTIENCSLFLGPHVDRQAPETPKLMWNFSWKYIGDAQIPANYPHW